MARTRTLVAIALVIGAPPGRADCSPRLSRIGNPTYGIGTVNCAVAPGSTFTICVAVRPPRSSTTW